MSTEEVTSKHTNLCLVVTSRASSRVSSEVTLLPLAQCYLNFGILFSSVASFFFFSLKLGGAPELSDIHDIQRCAK